MERSVFYDRKREAIFLLSLCLFGYVCRNFRKNWKYRPTLSRLIPDEKPTKTPLSSDFASAILSTVAGMRKNE